MVIKRFAGKRLESNAGAVFVTVALALVALLGFVAIIVDGMLTSSSQRQLIAAAQQTALAGLQTYLNSDVTLPYSDRVDLAIARANQIAGANNIISPPDRDISSPPEELGRLELWLSGCGDYPHGTPSCNGGQGGKFIPGFWYTFDLDTDSDGVPDDPCAGDYPCFIPNTSSTNTALNAVRVELGTVNPLRFIFAPILNQSSITVTGTGTASEVPRMGYFLVDLSGSTVFASHAFRNPVCDVACQANFSSGYTYTDPDLDITQFPPPNNKRLGSMQTRFAYLLDNSTIAPSPGTGYPQTDCSGLSVPGVYSLRGSRECYCGMDDDRATPPSDPGWSDPTIDLLKRYKSDFAPWPNTGIKDYQLLSSGDPTAFVLDRAAINGDTPAPEPLFSILDGINGAVNAFISRSVAGDKIAILGFDEKVWDPAAETRVFPLQANTSNYFTNLELATRTGWSWPAGGSPAPPDPVYNFVDKLLFPIPGRNTNMYAALQRALSDLQADPNSEGAQNFIAIVTDGLPTCLADNSCGFNYSTFNTAIAEINSNIIPLLVQHNIPLHIILVGDYVGPHTLNIDDPHSTDCLTDAAARKEGIDFTALDDGSGDPAGDVWLDAVDYYTGRQFFEPNYWFYQWARATGGGFYPIRPRDLDLTDCGGLPNATPAECRDCSNGAAPFQKQLYDPLDRTAQEQILQAFLQIMADSPFRLVDR